MTVDRSTHPFPQITMAAEKPTVTVERDRHILTPMSLDRHSYRGRTDDINARKSSNDSFLTIPSP